MTFSAPSWLLSSVAKRDTALMLFPLAQLISFLSQHYGLTAGDLIYTGTPEGVARLQSGDALTLSLDGLAQAQFTVA